MTTSKYIKALALGCACALLGVAKAQVTTNGNNISSPTDYVGCDGGSPFPLMIRHDANQPIEWYTNAVRRMLLHPTLTGQSIGTYGGLDLSGHLGIGLFSTMNVTRPFSLLHIDDGGNQFSGFRPWHKTGVTFTRGTDLGYVGLKHEGADVNSMALCWADNTLGDGPDRLKFIFLAQPIMANGIAGTLNGLEAVRVAPAGSGNETFFGIGDWFTTGGNADPRERLDILDGRVRIRQLPDDPEMTDPYLVMVVDNTTNPERGVVKWVDPANLPGGNDCDWIVDPNSTGTYDICTAYSGSSCQWDDSHNVGVGNTNPTAKVDVVKTVASNNPDVGVGIRMATSTTTVIGGRANVTTAQVENIGFQGNAGSRSRNYGVQGIATSPTTNGNVTGVYGYADGNFNTVTSSIRGVWGEGLNPASGGPGYGGWFDGYTHCTLGVWSSSDADLKQDVEPIEDALSVIAQLEPRSYRFQADNYPSLHLDAQTHFGLIAQEVETVLPELVRDAVQPEMLDTAGNVVAQAVEFKTMNYTELIPWLIAGMKEQQTQIQQQAAAIAQLQGLVANCCGASDTDADHGAMQGDQKALMNAVDRRLTIQPNPFVDRTMLAYTLDRSGQLLLVVSTPGGRQVQVLREGQAAEGSYTYEWETSSLASGMYYVTLLVDGEVVTRKAVKLGQ